MRFLVDAQLPPALGRYLAARSQTAEHVHDIGMGDATDREVWRYAKEGDAILVTKDEDFVTLQLLDASGPAVIWIRVGNTTNRALLEKMDRHISSIENLLKKGERLIEVGRQ
jgi:predicted nuclease of predicted toxin-antitoxin system